jgi:hypothetical protein
MAAKCDFAAEQLDERVRDQFVAWTCSDRIRERLLHEPSICSLQELITLALTVERAMAEAPALSSEAHAQQPAAAVGQVGCRQPRVSPASSQAGCWNCGQRNHTSRSSACPARGQVCRSCAKVGHFQSHCRGRAVNTTDRNTGRSDSRSPGPSGRSYSRRRRRRQRSANRIDDTENIDLPSDVNSLVINTLHVDAVKVCNPGTFKHVTARLNNVPIDFVLDLGAKVSIVSGSLFDKSMKLVATLVSMRQTLRTYSGQSITCRGCIEVSVAVDDIKLPSFKFYVTVKVDYVMGVDLFDALGGAVHMGDTSMVSRTAVKTVASAPPSSSPLQSLTQPIRSSLILPTSPSLSLSSVTLDEYPSITCGLGRLKGFVH